jgi:hypothetical protein
VRFRDDTRGVTVQIGAVLLFATIIIALATYQATVVPAQNADVEYQHSQTTQNQLTDVRNALLRTAASGNSQPASVTLGTQYPSRVFLMNPPPAAGSLGTERYDGNSTISVSNVNATDDETAEFFAVNGNEWSASTKYLAYQPGYHEYDGAPNLLFEATVLSNYYPDQNASVPLTDQILVDGDTITLVALNGSMSTSRAGSVSVDTTPVSAPYTAVQVEPQNDGEPVNVTVPTHVDADTLANATNLEDREDVTVTDTGDGRVTIELSGGGPFTLKTAKLGVGSGVTPEDPAYLTLVASDDDSVTVEARDRFNNPVGGVNVSVNGSNPFESGSVVTDESGRATFEVADGSQDTATLEILGGGEPRERVSADIDAESGGGWSGRVSYNGDAVARDGPDSNDVPGGVEFGVRNEFEQNATITDVTIEPADGTIGVLADRQSGDGKFLSELFVDADRQQSYVDFSEVSFADGTADGVRLPHEVDLDIDGRANPGNPVVGPGSNATVYLYEFFRSADGSTNVDMTGEPVNVTVTYRLASQQVGETEFTIMPAAPDDGGGDGSPTEPSLQSSSVTDNSDTSGPQFNRRARYDVSYDVSDPDDRFDRVEVVFDGSSDAETITSTAESDTVSYTGPEGSSGDEYTITIRVYNTDGDVVDTRTVTDTADGNDP